MPRTRMATNREAIRSCSSRTSVTWAHEWYFPECFLERIPEVQASWPSCPGNRWRCWNQRWTENSQQLFWEIKPEDDHESIEVCIRCEKDRKVPVVKYDLKLSSSISSYSILEKMSVSLLKSMIMIKIWWWRHVWTWRRVQRCKAWTREQIPFSRDSIAILCSGPPCPEVERIYISTYIFIYLYMNVSVYEKSHSLNWPCQATWPTRQVFFS